MTWDASEIRQLAADLDMAAATIAAKLRPIWSKAGVNIKKQLRDEMSQSEHFAAAAHRISYDLTTPADDTLLLEVGPTHGAGDPGSLGNIAYFGTSRGGGTVPDPMGALEAEVDNAVRHAEQLLGGLL